MIIWIFMILDGISLFGLSLLQFHASYSAELLIISGLYLIGKGIAFRDVMSIMDACCGVYILLALLFKIQSFFYYVILVWFIYKFSMLLIDFGN